MYGEGHVKIRPYQDEAATACLSQADSAPALLVLPTGMGKTVTMQEMARRRASKGPVLLLAHTDELCQQAADRFAEDGWAVFVEKAASRPHVQQIRGAVAQGYQVVVVGSVATMRGRRLQRWPREFFGLCLVDEAHHAVAVSYQAIMAHFLAPWIGVTATAGRKGLAAVFTSAYQITLTEAIEMGWLCPPRFKVIELSSWDLSQLRKPPGGLDVSDGELARIIEKAMPDALRPIREHLGSSGTGILFWPSVMAARRAAEWMQEAQVPAASVDGKTPREIRKEMVDQYRSGALRVISNCAVLTEGFDAPASSMVAMARPTRSLTMYAQMLGRGLRPLPGVVDAFAEGTNEQRRQAIAESAKPNCLVLDFEGTGAQFDLVSPVDLLAGSLPEAERKEAAEQMRRGAETVDEAVILAKREAAQKAAEERRQRQEARRRHEIRTGADYVAVDADYLSSPANRMQRKNICGLVKQLWGEEVAKQWSHMTKRWSAERASQAIEVLKKQIARGEAGTPDVSAVSR